ncbi:MAG: helix-hairpin-helix domain-containing protein [Elusimicrobia bacterium]|nr:helix-hairpin-helix domain-containing protein [Elusimicrobiota bacterium]
MDTARQEEGDIVQELADQPLDLNAASEEDLRRLPGVDRPLARRIFRERERRDGFESRSDLREVPGIDETLHEALQPFVFVQPKGVRPFPFSGDVRLRMRNVSPRGTTLLEAPPELQHAAYVYNRTRMRFGGRVQAGWLIKRAGVGPALTLGDIQRKAVVKFSMQMGRRGSLERMVLGDYTLSLGQGLLFYDGLGEFVRPVKVKAAGPRSDFTSGSNQYLRGAAIVSRKGALGAELYLSQKDLDLKLDSGTGTVNEDINRLRENLGDLQDEDDLRNNDTTSERLIGGRLSFTGPGSSSVGLTGAVTRYSRGINPATTPFAGSHAFRGDENTAASLDFDLFFGAWNLFGEAGRSLSRGDGASRQTGQAWTLTPLWRRERLSFWASFFDYDSAFFSRHGKGVSFSVMGQPEDLTDNQKGVMTGGQYSTSSCRSQLVLTLAGFPRAMGNGRNSLPIHSSEGRAVYFENALRPSKPFEFLVRYQRRDQEKRSEAVPGNGMVELRRQERETVEKVRYQAAWENPLSVRLLLRYETRHETFPPGKGRFGDLWMADLRFRVKEDLMLAARTYVFDSPQAYLNTGVEEIWDGVVYNRLAGAMNSLRGSPGTRFVVTLRQEIGPRVSAWLKYDVTRRPGDLNTRQASLTEQEKRAFSATRQGFHIQLDYRWGKYK